MAAACATRETRDKRAARFEALPMTMDIMLCVRGARYYSRENVASKSALLVIARPRR